MQARCLRSGRRSASDDDRSQTAQDKSAGQSIWPEVRTPHEAFPLARGSSAC